VASSISLSNQNEDRVALKPGQEVRIKNPNYMVGKIVRLTDSEPDGDFYLVEIEPRKLRLRASSFEVIEEPQPETKPKPGSWEWIAEARRAPAILQAAIDNPDDPTARNAMVETLDRLGLIMPIEPSPAA
jgi:hypothetical protein